MNLESNEIKLAEKIIQNENIDCDFEKKIPRFL